MVCHEAYKDQKGDWLYPDEILKIDPNNVIKKIDKTKVSVLRRVNVKIKKM